MKLLSLSRIFVYFQLSVFCYSVTDAQDCTGLPATNFLRLRLQTLIINDGGEGGSLTVTVQDGPFYTCQVQGTTMGTYQELSVILTYITDNNNSPRSRQFELDCKTVGGITDWDSRSGSRSSVLDDSVDYSSLGTFTNCSRCTSSAGNDNHCQACDSACNDGLMRCTGTTATDCCVAFEDDGVCKEDLNCNENNFVANEPNNFTCACGLSSCDDGYMFYSSSCNCTLTDICLADSSLCANGAVCMLEIAPDQYTCNCTGTNFIGPNCSVCNTSSLNCSPGYTINAQSCSCDKENICESDNPCANGVCMPGGTPDQYTCNCTGTNFGGTNCSVCPPLPCPLGLTTNFTSCTCVKENVCETNNPCANGVCIPGNTPDQYTCNCTGTNFTGPNCSVYLAVCNASTLNCTTGYTIDTKSCSCKENVCESDNPCINNGVCMQDKLAPDRQYSCNCTGTNYMGTNCSECQLLSCPVGQTTDSASCTCVKEDVCETNNPCVNGVCEPTDSSALYTCNCAGTNYNGTTCADCGLVCLNNGTADRYCRTCTCTSGYTGTNCSECADGYTKDRDTGTCIISRSSSSSSSSFQWWWVVIPVLLLLVIIAIVTVVAIVIVYFSVFHRNESSVL